ncbi:DUF1456 family protein [Ferrimonas pelagia]|uniref:DUF1456 family protein n=1 Tax=Ferrimonas pelagia TaxID=1177826 RepID=A0ABP9EDG2_9GAMM
MINNDILTAVRDILQYDLTQMVDVCAQAEQDVSPEVMENWLRKNGDPKYLKLSDPELATFLNGLINALRGKKEGAQPAPEQSLSNNAAFMKLRIAFELHADDVLEALELGGVTLSKHELSSFFRKPDNKHFRDCNDATLQAFLAGVAEQRNPAE